MLRGGALQSKGNFKHILKDFLTGKLTVSKPGLISETRTDVVATEGNQRIQNGEALKK